MNVLVTGCVTSAKKSLTQALQLEIQDIGIYSGLHVSILFLTHWQYISRAQQALMTGKSFTVLSPLEIHGNTS